MFLGGESIRVVHPLFQEEGGGSIPTSLLQLHIGEISLDVAICLNLTWHSRLPGVVKNNVQRVRHLVCFGAEHGGIYYASAIWTDPIARLLNGRNWLELRRFAIASDAPKNTASRMLRIMRNKIIVRWSHIAKLISYQDCDVHTGTIYKASGWNIGASSTNADGWQSRNRRLNQATGDKLRWELDVKDVLK